MAANNSNNDLCPYTILVLRQPTDQLTNQQARKRQAYLSENSDNIYIYIYILIYICSHWWIRACPSVCFACEKIERKRERKNDMAEAGRQAGGRSSFSLASSPPPFAQTLALTRFIAQFDFASVLATNISTIHLHVHCYCCYYDYTAFYCNFDCRKKIPCIYIYNKYRYIIL